MTLQDSSEDEELGGNLGGSEPEALALAGEVRSRLAWIVLLLQRRDEGREGAELCRATELLQGRHDAGAECLLDALDSEIPRRQPHDPVHACQGRDAVG